VRVIETAFYAPNSISHKNNKSGLAGLETCCRYFHMSSPSTLPARCPSPVYHASLALVTFVMLLLPCIYVALTAAAAYGVYFYATHWLPTILRWHLGHTVLVFVCAFTPLLVGGTITLFLIKPLFAPRARRMQPIAIPPELEPRIHQLSQEICRLLGAPVPARIEANCAVNASASFDRGLGGFFGNRLVLTLGMPLVAGLTQRELAGVIAHEFGHFRQGAGMRLNYLVRHVNGWFARVIYERDALDEALESAMNADSAWVAVMVACARIGVWFSRRVLWLLMIAGHAICALLLRQMEYDADEAEVRVAGSAAFESTALKLATLSAVMVDIEREMVRSWRKSLQLPDNLPLLLEHRHARLGTQRRAKIEGIAGMEKTHFLDTHPSTADRVRRARQLADPGLDISDASARDLFENFDGFSRLVTLAHYEDDLNVPTSPDFLIPLEAVIRATEAPAASTSAVAQPVPMMRFDPSAFRPNKPASE
jgi:Zn-dependent protease with chaperone function